MYLYDCYNGHIFKKNNEPQNKSGTDFINNQIKKFGYSFVLKNRYFAIMAFHLFTKFANFQFAYLSFMGEIYLVSCYYYVFYGLIAVAIVLIYPLIQMIKTFNVSNVED